MVQWNIITRFSRLAPLVSFFSMFVVGFYIGGLGSSPATTMHDQNADTTPSEERSMTASAETVPSVQPLAEGIYTDGTRVFAEVYGVMPAEVLVAYPAPSTLEHAQPEYGVYYRSGKQVLFRHSSGHVHQVDGADADTFTLDVPVQSTMMGSQTGNWYLNFAVDKDNVFVNGKRSFMRKGFRLLYAGSNKDCGNPAYVVALNPSTGTEDVWVETRVGWEPIEGADPETFVVLGTWYAKDKNHVYGGSNVTDYDPTTFGVKEAGDLCPIG